MKPKSASEQTSLQFPYSGKLELVVKTNELLTMRLTIKPKLAAGFIGCGQIPFWQ